MEKTKDVSHSQKLEFETFWDVYEEMAATNELMMVTMAMFATKFMSQEQGSATGGSSEQILQQLKSGYDHAATYFSNKNKDESSTKL